MRLLRRHDAAAAPAVAASTKMRLDPGRSTTSQRRVFSTIPRYLGGITFPSCPTSLLHTSPWKIGLCTSQPKNHKCVAGLVPVFFSCSISITKHENTPTRYTPPFAPTRIFKIYRAEWREDPIYMLIKQQYICSLNNVPRAAARCLVNTNGQYAKTQFTNACAAAALRANKLLFLFYLQFLFPTSRTFAFISRGSSRVSFLSSCVSQI